MGRNIPPSLHICHVAPALAPHRKHFKRRMPIAV